MKFLIFVFTLYIADVYALNLSDLECNKNDKVSLIYLNGVANTETDAEDSKEEVREIIKEKSGIASLKINEVCFGKVYNQTIGIGNPDYSDTLCSLSEVIRDDVDKCYIPTGDIVETIAQKIEEANELEAKEVNWSSVMQYLLKGGTVFQDNLSDERYEILKRVLENEKTKQKVFSSYAKYQIQTLNEIQAGLKRFVLHQDENGVLDYRPSVVVSHSQGNLFFNQMYTRLENDVEIPLDYLRNRFGNFQVGSAALESKARLAEYHKTGNDKIIDGLLKQGFGVREPDFWIYKGSDDENNHSFIETYTNGSAFFTPEESDYLNYLNTGNIALYKSFNVREVFYEKLNSLTEKVLKPVEPVQLNLTTACTNDSKIEFHLKTSDNFTSIELGTFVQNANSSGGNRSVLITYKNASEIPNVHYNETRKEYSFDYSLSNRSADTYFYVKACSSETLCQEEVTYIGRPEFDESNINSDGKLESVSVISHPDINVTESSHRIKFEAAGEIAINIDNPAHYVGCSVRTKELLPDGRVIQGVFVNYTTPELGVPAWYEVTSAVNTFEVNFSYNTPSCEDRTKFDGRSFEIVEPACEAEFEAARLYNANN